MIKHFVFVLLAVLCLGGVVKGQEGNSAIYYLSNLPQRVRLNPAYQPEYKVWIGLPALSGISVNYMNSSFGIDDILQKDGKDSLYVDIDRVYKSLRKRNIISFNNENSILSVGVRVNSWYATFDVSQKNDFVFRTNKELFTFLRDGNANYLGKTMELGKLGLKVNMYDEFAFGLSKKLNSKWTVGARAKFLLGIANVDMRNSKIDIHSTKDAGTLELRSKQDIRISAPVTISENVQNGQYIDWDDFDVEMDDFKPSMILNTKNLGFAMDFGAEYQFNDKIKFYASLVDLGFIHWGGKNYRLYQDTKFDWKGADISNSVNPDAPGYIEINDAFEDLVDSLKDNFRLKRGEGAYTTMLRGKLYAGATYDLNKKISVAGLLQMTLMDKAFYPSLTASANARVIRNFSASVSYTVMPGNYVNLGIGFTAKLGPVQLYASTDNLMAVNYTSTQSANGRFGINLLFGHKDKKKKEKVEEVLPVVVVAPIKKTPEVKKDTVDKDTAVVKAPRVEPIVQKEEVIMDRDSLLKPYHVIVGSFKSKARAERLKSLLIKAGAEDSQVMLSEVGMYRVSCASYNTREEAWQEVYKIREEYPKYSDAWVLKAN